MSLKIIHEVIPTINSVRCIFLSHTPKTKNELQFQIFFYLVVKFGPPQLQILEVA